MRDRLYGEVPDDFKLVKSRISRFDWDAILRTPHGDRLLDIYHIQELPHSRRPGSIECLWACPRGEVPTHENLAAYSGHGCCWGIEVEECDRFRSGNGFNRDDEYCKLVTCWITRNGERFYRVTYGRDIATALVAAQYKLAHLQEHPVSLFLIEWEKEVLDRPIFFRGVPSYIRRMDKELGIFVVPETGPFPPSAYAKSGQEIDDWYDNYGDGLWTDFLDEEITWHRDAKAND